MKKYYFLIIVALIFGLVLTGCSLLSNIGQAPATNQSGMTYVTKGGPTESEAESFPLYAGQDWEVGEVLVWNDDTQVCVKYVLDPAVFADGWGLTETHLAIVTDPADVPQTKPKKGEDYGNPKVGHFPYGNDELAGVAEDGPYCIPFGTEEGELDVDCGDTIVIAAHAVVCKLGEMQEFTLVSNSDTMTAGWTGTDPESDPLNPVMYGSGDGAWNNAVDLSSPNPGWYTENSGFFSGAYWISTYDELEGPVGENSWRLFKEDFNIPSEAVNISATLHMAADNAVKAYLNGVLGGGTDLVFVSEGYPGNIGSQPYYFKTDQGPFYPDILLAFYTSWITVINSWNAKVPGVQ